MIAIYALQSRITDRQKPTTRTEEIEHRNTRATHIYNNQWHSFDFLFTLPVKRKYQRNVSIQSIFCWRM